MDAINWSILKYLQSNSRSSYSEIGREIGLTSPAVAERIKKMEDAGIIRAYSTIIAHQKVGYQFKAIITLKAFMGRLKPFLETVKSFKEVLNCYRITGNENIIMEVVLYDQAHLERLIDKLITYGETKTNIILSNVIEEAPITKDA